MSSFGDLAKQMLAERRDPVIGRIVKADREGEHDETIERVAIIGTQLSTYMSEHGYSIGTLVDIWQKNQWLVRDDDQRRPTKSVKINGASLSCYIINMPVSTDDGENANHRDD